MRSEPRRSGFVGAPTLVEIGMVTLSRKRRAGLEQMRALLRALRVDVVPSSAEQADLALDAFERFGKGRHPASLNFGDCLTYALAKAMDEPLPFKGDDFSKTDIAQAVWEPGNG